MKGVSFMKHVTILEYDDGSGLREKVNAWITENESEIIEIIDIEYTNSGKIYLATITYEERQE